MPARERGVATGPAATLERWLVLIEYDDQLWVWLASMDLERG